MMTMHHNPFMGWVVVDKPSDMPSSWVTHRVKRAFKARRAGHAGTLDPLATGMLPIALNQTTRLIPFLMSYSKTYTFTVFWGHETTTDDVRGDRIEGQEGPCPDLEQIEKILNQFQGEILQRPPSYSAVKIKGVAAYRHARQGRQLILSQRPVKISSLKVLAHRAQETDFEVVCSTGTYVRSLARDMARALQTYGHILALRRTSVGPFDHGCPVEDLTQKDSFYSPEAALSHLQRLTLNSQDVLGLWQGRVLKTTRGVPDGCIACYDEKNQLVALVDKNDQNLKPLCSFIRP